MYYSCWKTYRDCSKVLVIIAFIGWIAGIVWIGAFFGIFYENLNFDYKPAYNCTIQNITSINLDGNEKYSSLQIQFQKEINSENYFIGQACASSYKKRAIVYTPQPYRYYKKGDQIKCGENFGEGNQQFFINNTFYYPSLKYDGEDGEQQQQTRRILKSAGKGGGGNTGGGTGSTPNPGGGDGTSSPTKGGTNTKNTQQTKKSQDHTGIEERDCKYTYNMTNIKISAWNCLKDNNLYEIMNQELEKPFTYSQCQYTVYGKNDKAQKNSQEIIQNEYTQNKIQDFNDFYMIIFEKDLPYYDKLSLLVFIAFFLVPFLLFPHICWLVYIANRFEPYFIGFLKDLAKCSFQKKRNKSKLAKHRPLQPMYTYKSAAQIIEENSQNILIQDKISQNENNIMSNENFRENNYKIKDVVYNTSNQNSQNNLVVKNLSPQQEEEDNKIAHFLVHSSKSNFDQNNDTKNSPERKNTEQNTFNQLQSLKVQNVQNPLNDPSNSKTLPN